jgi:hypothetical protein
MATRTGLLAGAFIAVVAGGIVGQPMDGDLAVSLYQGLPTALEHHPGHEHALVRPAVNRGNWICALGP